MCFHFFSKPDLDSQHTHVCVCTRVRVRTQCVRVCVRVRVSKCVLGLCVFSLANQTWMAYIHVWFAKEKTHNLNIKTHVNRKVIHLLIEFNML